MTDVYHVITPGDHFSPRTGSAIPTVVAGLSAAAREDPGHDYRHHVVLDRTTFTPRYTSAEVIECAPAAPAARGRRVLDYPRAVLGLPRRELEKSYAPAVAALRSLAPGIVIAHNAPFLGEMLSGSGHRVVLYAHNALPASMRRAEARRWLGSAAALVCVSSDQAELARSRLPHEHRGRVRVVRHGVDTAVFQPSPRPAQPRRFVFVGRTIREKGVDVLLDAAAQLRRDEVEVLIVGSHGFDAGAPLTRYERDLRRRAQRCAVDVTFRPFTDRSELPALLASAHVLVVPSRWREPSGLTVGEGMASGALVIASDVGGIPEVLGDSGALVPPGDPAALGAAMERAIDDVPWRQAQADAALARARRHDWGWSWRQLRGHLDSV